MPEVTLRDFSGGLVDYFSPTDISDKQFQVFTGLENERLGRLELLKIPAFLSGGNSPLGINLF